MSKHIRECGNLSPTEELQSFFFDNDLKHLLRLIPAQLLLWKEEHSNAVFPLFSDLYSEGLRHSRKEFMRNLGQNTDTVSGLSLCILTCPVLQILHNFQSIFHCLTALLPFDIDTGTDTAVIMLKHLTIKRCLRYFLLHIKHGCTPFCSRLPTHSRSFNTHAKRAQGSYYALLCALCFKHYTILFLICK